MTDTLIIDGDSHPAVRFGVTDAQTWGAIVAGWHGWGHANRAVPGSKDSDVLARLSTTLADADPATTHYALQIWANNAWVDPSVPYDFSTYWTAPQPSAISVPQSQANLQAIIDQARPRVKSITLVTPWAMWATAELDQFPFYVDAMKAVGLAKGVPVVDAFDIAVRRWWSSSAPNHTFAAPSFYGLYNTLGDGVTTDYQHPSAAGHIETANLFRKPHNAGSALYYAG